MSDQELLFEVIHSEPLDTCLDRLLALSRQRGEMCIRDRPAS